METKVVTFNYSGIGFTKYFNSFDIPTGCMFAREALKLTNKENPRLSQILFTPIHVILVGKVNMVVVSKTLKCRRNHYLVSHDSCTIP